MTNTFYKTPPSSFTFLRFSPVCEYFIAREFDLNFLLPEHVLFHTPHNIFSIYVAI